MNILIDSWSSQVLFQQIPPSYPPANPPGEKPNVTPTVTGMRLNTLLGAINSIGCSSGEAWNVGFTTPPITASQLSDVNVYISLTREQGAGYAYTPSELEAIEQYVAIGGNVLLMTNHGGLPNDLDDNYMHNDKALAALFDIKLKDYFVTGSNLVIDIEATVPYLSYQVNTLTAHDSCIIEPPAVYTSLATFPLGWTAFDPKHPTKAPSTPKSSCFAIMVPGITAPAGTGQVIVIGNSGWVGDIGSPLPAPGLVSLQNNLTFVLNCIGYLGGITEVAQNPINSPM